MSVKINPKNSFFIKYSPKKQLPIRRKKNKNIQKKIKKTTHIFFPVCFCVFICKMIIKIKEYKKKACTHKLNFYPLLPSEPGGL